MICSDCFNDEGLRLMSEKIGFLCTEPCQNCKSIKGSKLDKEGLLYLADRFFRAGTMQRFEYGAAPAIKFNDKQETSVFFDSTLDKDASLISSITGMGFFHYGPRFWMFGETEPLKALQDESKTDAIIDSIISAYPSVTYKPDDKFYRLRKNPSSPEKIEQYDSPPTVVENGRLDTHEIPVMYASFNLEVCIHECRSTADDEMYLATLKPVSELKMIDFSVLLQEENVTEFESLDIAVFMLFMARSNSYPILRRLSCAVMKKGYDGIVYPSYFSMLHSGAEPFETTYGISHRRISLFREHEESKVQKNLAIFGHPIKSGKVKVDRINKLFLRKITYGVEFGPVHFR